MISNELLKNKVYQLAFSGKLVNNEQNSIKINVVDVEGDYELPSNWKWFRVTDLFDFVGGSQPPKSEFSDELKDGYVRLYQTRDYGEKPIPVFVKKDSVSKFTNDEDILLARYGGSLGKVFRAKQGAYNVAMAKVVFKYECMNVDYVYDFFLSPLYQKFVKTLSKMAQAGFNQNDLGKLLIPVPPIEEQKRIVDKIAILLDLIEKKEKNDKEKTILKEVLKKKILDSAIHGTLIKNDIYLEPVDVKSIDNTNYNIPSNWKVTLMGNVGNWKAGSTPSKDNSEYYNGGNIPWLLTGDLNDGFVNSVNHFITQKAFDECSLRLNPINSVLIAMYGATIGRVAINKIETTTNQACCACICDEKIVDYNYLFYYLISIREKLKSKAEGAGQPNISKQKISNTPILLPPLEEQKRIVEKIESLFELIEQL